MARNTVLAEGIEWKCPGCGKVVVDPIDIEYGPIGPSNNAQDWICMSFHKVGECTGTGEEKRTSPWTMLHYCIDCGPRVLEALSAING